MRSLFIFLIFCLSSAYPAEEKKPIRVYVDIVGDLFHAGHIEFLKKAKKFGDILIVGVLGDSTVEGYKRRPILSLSERVKVIEACKYVDEVIIAPPLRLTDEMIQDFRIDYVVHGDDFDKNSLEDQYGVAIKRGIFRTVPYTSGISTTEIIHRISSRHDLGEFQTLPSVKAGGERQLRRFNVSP